MKKILLLLVALCSMLTSSHLRAAQVDLNNGYYGAFITVSDDFRLADLNLYGAVATAEYDGFIIAQIPNTLSVSDVLAVPGVLNVSEARTLLTLCDSVRYYSYANEVIAGTGFDMPYTGKGVIVGLIDCGFDFNHINLCDANGATRVKAVYLPMDSTGNSPRIGGYRLPGSCYETPEQICALTTDDPNTTHGTQMAGISAGGYRANGWHGMAPDAEIVACAMPEGDLNDVRVANSINYIYDYARRVGKPCVINISLGTNVGPHDGTSYLTKVCEQLAGPGRVCVVAAGNDGYQPVCLRDHIENKNDTVTALVSGYGGGLERSGYVNVWSNVDKVFNTRLIVMDVNTKEIVYRSKPLGATSTAVSKVFSSETDTTLAKYYTGSVEMRGCIETNGRPTSLCNMNMRALASKYVMGFQFFGPSETDIVAWTSHYAYFKTYGVNGVSEATSASSINDLATNDSIISVGSYNSKQYVLRRDGVLELRSNSEPMTLSYFTAYGPDENGKARPDVCAPGNIIITSGNRYDTNPINLNYWQTPVYVGGVEYPYCPDIGTSMSAPVVAGAVAVWMQANPDLGAADVRDILYNSSYKDKYVTAADAPRWGSGKLNVAAGLRYVLDIPMLPGDVNLDGEINIADINAIITVILGGNVDAETMKLADVNNDGEVNIADVNMVIDLILG